MKRATMIIPAVLLPAWLIIAAPPARADICPYPGVGEGGGALFAQGGFCDYPTEANGSHMHCEAGGFGVSGILGQSGNNGGSIGFGGAGIGALSCTWRCPDGALSPAPNPPGMWQHYLIPMKTSYCAQGHMDPNGFWSAPVLPTEGIPPAPGEPPPPPALAPGEPNP